MSPVLRRVARGTIAGNAAIVGIVMVIHLAGFGSGYLRNFHVPSEAMAPTLEKKDRFVAFMNGGANLKRGEIILLAVGESTYIKRVAAVAGDTIGLRDGIVILNGRPVTQRLVTTESRPESGGAALRRLAEQFPGEAAPHEIFDMGASDVDDFPETPVPAGFAFVLGDHRDRSADSRVPRTAMGVELLPVADIRGRPLFYAGPRAKFGRKVNR